MVQMKTARVPEDYTRTSKYHLEYFQKERGQVGRHFYQKIPLGYQGKYQRAQNVVGKSSRVSTRMPLW